MLKQGFQLGGEKSGHTVFLNYSTTGDGLITSLQLLNVMINENSPLSALSSIFEKPYEFSIDIPVKTKIPLENIKGYDRFKKDMDSKINSGRIYIRYSGTEPKLRILVEGYDEENVKSIGKEIREFFLKNLDLAEE
jgi:phosphoglucosamine mutase